MFQSVIRPVYAIKWGIWIHFNPVDATTYYLGDTQGSSLNQGRSQIYIPMAGTIIAADCHFLVNGTLGSTETSSVNLRVNNTTDYLITSAAQQNATVQRYLGSMSAVVAASDYFEIKWITPSWVTNPTNVRYFGNVIVRV